MLHLDRLSDRLGRAFVVLYQAVFERWIAEVVGAHAATVVGWVLAGAFITLIVAGAVGDVHAAVSSQRSTE